MDKLGEKICKRYDRLKSARGTWESRWEQISDHMAPERRGFVSTPTPGERRTHRIFDTTAQQARDTLVNALMSGLMNPASQWFVLAADDDLMENGQVKQWLDGARDIMLQVINDPRSGFYSETHEFLQDVAQFGTGLFFEQQVETPRGLEIQFSAMSLAEGYIEEDHHGIVDSILRRYPLTAIQAVEKFGEDKVGKDITKAVADNKWDQEFYFLQWIAPVERMEELGGRISPQFEYGSVHVDAKEKTIMREGGFYRFPVQALRYEKATGDIGYGRGPGTKALDEIKMVNAMRETIIRAAQKAVDPPLFAPTDGFAASGGKFSRSAGSTNFHDGTITQDRMWPEPQGQRPDLGVDMLQDARQQIEGHFLRPLLISPDDGPQRTATEILQRRQERGNQLGPIVHRAMREFMTPMLENVFHILERNNQFDPAPEALGDRRMEIKFTSPLAQLAGKGDEASAIMTLMETLPVFAGLDPSVTDMVDVPMAAKEMGDSLLLPPGIIRDMQEFKKRLQERKQAEQAAMMAQAGVATGQAANQWAQAGKHAAEAGAVQ